MLEVTEAQRLEALHRYDILDTEPEPYFDHVVELAAKFFAAPIAAISLIDTDRQWFKARTGIEPRETPRTASFCDHTIRSDQIMVVPDASLDARFSGNALVVDDPHVRFYAGAPLTTNDGARIGALCVIDSVPRDGPLPAGIAFLESLAATVVAAIERRRVRERDLYQWPGHA